MNNTTPYIIYDPRASDRFVDLSAICGRELASRAKDSVVISCENRSLVENDWTIRRFFRKYESRSLMLFVDSRTKRSREIENHLTRESQSSHGYLTVFKDQPEGVDVAFDCMRDMAEYNGETWVYGLYSDSSENGLSVLRQESFLKIEHFEERLPLFDCILFRSFDYVWWTLYFMRTSHFDEAIAFFETTALQQLQPDGSGSSD